jgi:hypothetical protein
MYKSFARFDISEYNTHPNANLIRSKYFHTYCRFDYHPGRFYDLQTKLSKNDLNFDRSDRSLRVFPDHVHSQILHYNFPDTLKNQMDEEYLESKNYTDIIEFEKIRPGNKNIELPMLVKNINGMAVCEFRNIKIKVTPDIINLKCHNICTPFIYNNTNCPTHLINQTAYCAQNVYAAYLIQNIWRKKKGYIYNPDYKYNTNNEHITDIKGMIYSIKTQMIDKYDHKNGTTWFNNRFTIPLVNINGELFLEINYKKMNFYRNYVFEREYHYLYDNGSACCGNYIYKYRNYRIYDLQTAYCCKNIEMAMRIQKKWKYFKKMKILWKIAEHYMANKYSPANIHKYIELD